MARPKIYERFANFFAYVPTSQFPGSQVETEFDRVKQSLDETQNALNQVRRDDGAVANRSIGFDQLKPEINGFGTTSPTAWQTGTEYLLRDAVFIDRNGYTCVVEHVSTDFDEDLAAGFWELFFDGGEAFDLNNTVFSVDGRAAATVTAVPEDAQTLRLVQNGQVLEYLRDPTGTALTTLGGTKWSPAGDWYLEHWGEIVYSDGSGSGGADSASTDCSVLFQAAIDFAIARTGGYCVINLRDRADCGGGYKVAQQIDCTNSALDRIKVIGKGCYYSFIHPTPFGADKAVFRFSNTLQAGSRSSFIGFDMARAIRHKSHPVGIMAPAIGALNIENVKFTGLGNTAIVAARLYNERWGDIQVATCGWSFLEADVPSTLTISTTSGGTTVTASESFFNSSHIGKVIYLQQTNSSQSPRNSGLATTITAVASGTSFTIADPAIVTGSGRLCSFDTIKGSINSGSTTLTISRAVLDSTDIGRLVYIEDAHDERNTHVARVTAVSGTTITLDSPATRTVSGVNVWFTPAVALGSKYHWSDTPINDHFIDDIRIESCRGGPGIMAVVGLHLYITNYKFHGVSVGSSGNNFYSAMPLHLSSIGRSVIGPMEFEYGQRGIDNGYVTMRGDQCTVDLQGMCIAGATLNAYVVDFRPTDLARSTCHIGSIQSSIGWQYEKGLVNYGAATSRTASVYSYGPVFGDGETKRPQFAGRQRIGTYTSVELVLTDDSFDSIELPSNHGMVFITMPVTTTYGQFYYRSVPNSLVQIAAGADLEVMVVVPTGTNGTDGKFGVHYANNRLYVQNRMGASYSVAIAFLN